MSNKLKDYIGKSWDTVLIRFPHESQQNQNDSQPIIDDSNDLLARCDNCKRIVKPNFKDYHDITCNLAKVEPTSYRFVIKKSQKDLRYRSIHYFHINNKTLKNNQILIDENQGTEQLCNENHVKLFDNVIKNTNKKNYVEENNNKRRKLNDNDIISKSDSNDDSDSLFDAGSDDENISDSVDDKNTDKNTNKKTNWEEVKKINDSLTQSEMKSYDSLSIKICKEIYENYNSFNDTQQRKLWLKNYLTKLKTCVEQLAPNNTEKFKDICYKLSCDVFNTIKKVKDDDNKFYKTNNVTNTLSDMYVKNICYDNILPYNSFDNNFLKKTEDRKLKDLYSEQELSIGELKNREVKKSLSINPNTHLFKDISHNHAKTSVLKSAEIKNKYELYSQDINNSNSNNNNNNKHSKPTFVMPPDIGFNPIEKAYPSNYKTIPMKQSYQHNNIHNGNPRQFKNPNIPFYNNSNISKITQTRHSHKTNPEIEKEFKKCEKKIPFYEFYLNQFNSEVIKWETIFKKKYTLYQQCNNIRTSISQKNAVKLNQNSPDMKRRELEEIKKKINFIKSRQKVMMHELHKAHADQKELENEYNRRGRKYEFNFFQNYASQDKKTSIFKSLYQQWFDTYKKKIFSHLKFPHWFDGKVKELQKWAEKAANLLKSNKPNEGQQKILLIKSISKPQVMNILQTSNPNPRYGHQIFQSLRLGLKEIEKKHQMLFYHGYFKPNPHPEVKSLINRLNMYHRYKDAVMSTANHYKQQEQYKKQMQHRQLKTLPPLLPHQNNSIYPPTNNNTSYNYPNNYGTSYN